MKRIASSGPPLTAFDSSRDAGSDPGFSATVIQWQREYGRHALPWQAQKDPYRIWLSEIMLQQTQVATVIPYYVKFLAQFPDVASLAAAPVEQVMALWSGLGYYTRARNLHACARHVGQNYGGVFPSDPHLLAALPGIGRSTAAAIAAFAYGTRAAILDANVKRVLCRVFGVEGYPGSKAVEQILWQRAEALLPDAGVEPYTQGLMDLGATLCSRARPQCSRCPLATRCVALATDRVALLPQRKPGKVVPLRHTVMLVLVDGAQVLLEQRPPTGIWGGLLSLPEVDAENALSDRAAGDAIDRAAAQFGSVMECTRLTPFVHGFSHFKLHVTPFLVRLSQRTAQVAEARYLWHRTAGLADAALPAPVKKLLLTLCHADLLSPT